MAGLVIQAQPATEPITVTELKTHLRIDTTADDTELGLLITTARQYVERHMNRTFVTTTYDLYMDGFDDPFFARNGVIYLPRPPLSSVTHVKYYDTANVEQTWTSTEYSVDIRSEPGRVCEASGFTFPATYDKPSSVNVRFVAGEGAAASVAEYHKQSVRFLAGHLYENRESSSMGTEVKDIPMAYQAYAMLDQVWQL